MAPASTLIEVNRIKNGNDVSKVLIYKVIKINLAKANENTICSTFQHILEIFFISAAFYPL
jgi:hypothetical protein